MRPAMSRGYPGDFQPGIGITVRHPYPNIPRSACDMVFTTSTYTGPDPEWAVELKVIRFIGDNGGKNPYGAGNFLSPYKMETSFTTDLVSQHNSTIGPRRRLLVMPSSTRSGRVARPSSVTQVRRNASSGCEAFAHPTTPTPGSLT